MKETNSTHLPTGINRIIGTLFETGWQRDGKVLDCGCGEGEVGSFLLRRLQTDSVLGIDISQDKLKLADTLGIKTVCADFDRNRNLPFKDSSFDLVFCNHVLEHMIDPDHLLEEIYRILKSGAMLVLATPNLAAWYNRIILLLGFQPHFTEVSLSHNVGKLYFGSLSKESKSALGGHIRLFTYPALKQVLGLHNFSIITSFSYGHPALLSSKIAGPIEKLSQLSKSFSSTLCFICRKKSC